jgi:hypothetical protein
MQPGSLFNQVAEFSGLAHAQPGSLFNQVAEFLTY